MNRSGSKWMWGFSFAVVAVLALVAMAYAGSETKAVEGKQGISPTKRKEPETNRKNKRPHTELRGLCYYRPGFHVAFSSRLCRSEPVIEGLQPETKICVFGKDVGRTLELDWRKIQNAANSSRDQQVGSLLRPVRLYGNHAYLSTHFLDYIIHGFYGGNLYAANPGADSLRFSVECCHKCVSVVHELGMPYESPAKISCPHQTQMPFSVQTKDFSSLRQEFFDIIANTPNSELTKVGEILPDLCWIHAADVGHAR